MDSRHAVQAADNDNGSIIIPDHHHGHLHGGYDAIDAREEQQDGALYSKNLSTDTMNHLSATSVQFPVLHDDLQQPAIIEPRQARPRPPDSAPPVISSFLRRRSSEDSSMSEDDEDDDDNEHRLEVTNNNKYGDLEHHLQPDHPRYQSPALARRRYPSSASNATTFLDAAAIQRRSSSRARRVSMSTDLKGKGAMRRDTLNDNEDDTHSEEAEQEDNSQHARRPNGLTERLPSSVQRTTSSISRRSFSQSNAVHPSRRYTTSYDPFTSTSGSTIPPDHVHDVGSTSKMRKKRSYTFAGPGHGRGSNKQSRNASGSSSPDLSRISMNVSPITHLDSTSRRKAHLPRSASEFSTLPGGSMNGHTRPPQPRRPHSGSSSPLHPRSQSSSNILTSDANATNDGISTSKSPTSSFPNGLPSPSLAQQASTSPLQPILRTKLSGLHMRNSRSSSSRKSPIKTTFSNTSTPQRENSVSSSAAAALSGPGQPSSSRKRAKSNLYPLDGLGVGTPTSSAAADATKLNLPARAVSSQHARRSASDAYDVQYARSPKEQDDIFAFDQKRRKPTEETSISGLPPPSSSSTMDLSTGRSSTLKSISQPVSIASLVQEERQQQAGLPANQVSSTPAGPSLQELLSQVDLKSALTLVREANGGPAQRDRRNSTTTATGLTGQSPFGTVRSSIDTVPSTYRSTSPPNGEIRSIFSSRDSNATSPAGNSTLAGRTPLLSTRHKRQTSHKAAQEGTSMTDIHPTTSMRIIELPADSTDGKKKKRLSMKRFLGGGSGSSHKTHDQSQEGRNSEDYSFISSSNLSSFTQQSDSRSQVLQQPLSEISGDPFEEIRAKISPAIMKYVASVKSELEIRYLPIFTALAMGHQPPNPVDVARQLASQEADRKSRSLNGTSPTSPSSKKYMEEGRFAAGGGAGKNGQPAALADRIRKKGHRRSIWEVYPRDIADYTLAASTLSPRTGSSSLDLYPYHSDATDSLRHSNRLHHYHDHLGHRHASSEISLRSLASIREGQALDAFMSDSQPRHGQQHLGRSSRVGLTAGQGLNKSSISSIPLSPTRSGQSDISSHLASDDALASGAHLYRERHSSDLNPGWMSDGLLQSSPEHARWKHSPLLPPHMHGSHHSTALKLLHPDGLNGADSISDHGRLAKSTSERLFNRSMIGRRRNTHGGTESEAYGEGHLAAGNDAAVYKTDSRGGAASDGETRVSRPWNMLDRSRPAMSRSTSKTSSLVGLSKILGGKRIHRHRESYMHGKGRDDGYRSTDNEEHLQPKDYMSDSRGNGRVGRTSVPNHSIALQRRTPSGGIRRDRDSLLEDDQESVISVFDVAPSIQIREVDVDDEEMERAERFLHDLKASLSKAEALARRVPPKMNTYLQNYFDYDSQRMQKGQLAALQLAKPPVMCRLFISMHNAGQPTTTSCEGSGASTPVNQRSRSMSREASLDRLATPRKPCFRRGSDSSLPDDEKRTPLLEKVTVELNQVSQALDEATAESRKVLEQQDAAKDKIQEVVEMANEVDDLIGTEVSQQLRLLEDHMLRFKYHISDTRGYADAAWAVLSYILRLFFWFSWIGVTLLRLVKATIMLPFTVVVTILRWIFF